MGRQHLSPDAYGDAAVEWPDGLFSIRITNEPDAERVRAARDAEVERSDPRKPRVGLCNRRLDDLEE